MKIVIKKSVEFLGLTELFELYDLNDVLIYFVKDKIIPSIKKFSQTTQHDIKDYVEAIGMEDDDIKMEDGVFI